MGESQKEEHKNTDPGRIGIFGESNMKKCIK